jgi:hypothetical protein
MSSDTMRVVEFTQVGPATYLVTSYLGCSKVIEKFFTVHTYGTLSVETPKADAPTLWPIKLLFSQDTLHQDVRKLPGHPACWRITGKVLHVGTLFQGTY